MEPQQSRRRAAGRKTTSASIMPAHVLHISPVAAYFFRGIARPALEESYQAIRLARAIRAGGVEAVPHWMKDKR